MKLNYSHSTLAELFQLPLQRTANEEYITSVSTDTRTIIDGSNTLFFALENKRNGADFIPESYRLGCRNFVVKKGARFQTFGDAIFYEVEDPLQALQALAKYHRSQWKGKVIAITGSSGKTIVKEWLSYLLQDIFVVVRSPKSYNSQLGVALSLLQLEGRHNLAIIEAGISQKGEMKQLADMIQPDYGILTNIGSAHDTGFASRQEKKEEKLLLFQSCKWVLGRKIDINELPNALTWQEGENVSYSKIENETEISFLGNKAIIPFTDNINIENATQVVFACSTLLKEDIKKVLFRTKNLIPLAMRMEFLQGKRNNTLINDCYSIDIESVVQIAEIQNQNEKFRTTLLILALLPSQIGLKDEIENQLQKIDHLRFHFCSPDASVGLLSYQEINEILEKTHDSLIVFKASRSAELEEVLHKQLLLHHTTSLEINRQALRFNLSYYQKKLSSETDMMVMVKASSYGSGSIEMTRFLEDEGIRYFGVAYTDEGVELRNAGIRSSIVVMNAEKESFEDMIHHQLEPALFSMEQLDAFTHALIHCGKVNYPIHIKLDTGMKRLGFNSNELGNLIAFVQAQPELKIESVYSHFAESSNPDKTFTLLQISRFEEMTALLQSVFNHRIKRHICNTDGIENYPQAHYEMVRLGIGLFGIENPKLRPALSFITHVSKINTLKKGESLGYNRSYVAQKDEEIAILMVGYADGLRRSLGNGKGSVWINGKLMPIIGNVCMDMCFVNVTDMNVKVGERVTLFGEELSVKRWAEWMETISYEVITGISKRVVRVWVE